MAVDTEMLEAMRAMMKEELKPVKAEIADLRVEMQEGFKFLEACVNEAAKDTQLTIKQHEKEWHSA